MKINLLNEELTRIKLLYGYKLESTLSENKKKVLINEKFAAEVFKGSEVAAKELANAERTALKAGLEASFKELGQVTILDSRGVAMVTKDAEEIINAMKNGLIAPLEMGRISKGLLKNATSLEVKILATEVITDMKSFGQKYGGKTREYIVTELSSGGKYTKSEAENLADRFLKKQKKIPIKINKVEPIKVEPVKVEPIKVEPIKSPEPKIVNNNTNNIRIEIEGGGTKSFKTPEEFIAYEKAEGEAFASKYGEDFNGLAKEKGYKTFEDFVKADETAAKEAVKEAAEGSKGIFSRIIGWGKRTIRFKVLFGLAKIAGIGWLVWYLFFSGSGKKVKCPEGQEDDGKGNCIGSGGKRTEDGNKTNNGNKTNDGNKTNNGNFVMDSNGNKYVECEPPYYKGCVAKKGNQDIRTIQDCLGITPNGFFNQETESALKNKINKMTFNKSDIPAICAKSYGASNFSY